MVKIQRWPRYWATIDAAETGASDALHTAYFAGYDDTSIVYTGQDVIRFLDRKTGKQRKQAGPQGQPPRLWLPAPATDRERRPC